MKPGNSTILIAAVMLLGTASYGQADHGLALRASAEDMRLSAASMRFNRIATFANYRNNANLEDETVSEIVAATEDGETLVYTDGELEALGFVDISDPKNPQPLGTFALEGEPTSVDVLGNAYALAAVVTDGTFTAPKGELVVVDIATRAQVGEAFDLGGQPDSLKISPDGRYAAIVIENERDEEICVGGTNDAQPAPEDDDAAAEACEAGGGQVGVIPQNGPDTTIGNPPGFLVILDIVGSDPAGWTTRVVELAGLADFAPTDPEPEFIDINEQNLAAISLQENNHLVVVDLASGNVQYHFALGSVTLSQIDATEDDLISLTETLKDVPREPDAVAWVPMGPDADGIATANEGDMFGGSRGFTIFGPDGFVIDSGNSFEHLAVQHGHYPEGRSENKGSEPESIEYGRYGRRDYLFVGSERGSFVAVYELSDSGLPQFQQVLNAPLGPEGILAIPSRDLLVVSGEVDDPSFGVRSSMMIYELQDAIADYPQIVSADGPGGAPIGWSALSGMDAFPGNPEMVLAVWDSFFSEAKVFGIDVSATPAIVRHEWTLTGGSGDYDGEGIAVAPDGFVWIASEGDDPGARANRLLKVDTNGNVAEEVGLPAEIEACRAASTDTANLDNGFEGVAVFPGTGGDYLLLLAQQLPWTYTDAVDGIDCEALDDEPGFTRIWIYNPTSGVWSHVAYELAPTPANASWVGLSEISRAPDGDYVLIERDNRTGDFAELKTLVKVPVSAADDGVIRASEKNVFDLIPELEANDGWITDKPEGVAITPDGKLFLATDNDGVDDWSGETWFLNLGNYDFLFSR